MNALLGNVVLAIVWMFVTEKFSPANLFIGFVVGYFITWGIARAGYKSGYFEKVPRSVAFVLWFLRELLVANLKMAYYTVAPLNRMKPGIIAVPLEPMTDFEISLLGNLITLTPGTLTLDVSDDRSVIYVHAVDASDPDGFVRSVQEGFARRVLDLTR